MTTPDITEPLQAMIARLDSLAALTAIIPVANIRTHLPEVNTDNQTFSMPWLMVEYDVGDQMDSKTHQGFRQQFSFSIWTNEKDQGTVLQVMQIINNALHNQPLVLSSGASVLLQYSSGRTIKEPDGTASGRMTFNHMLTEA